VLVNPSVTKPSAPKIEPKPAPVKKHEVVIKKEETKTV